MIRLPHVHGVDCVVGESTLDAKTHLAKQHAVRNGRLCSWTLVRRFRALRESPSVSFITLVSLADFEEAIISTDVFGTKPLWQMAYRLTRIRKP